MSEVRNLEPKSVWNHFEDLNAVPRPSKKEELIIEFVKQFGEGLQLDTTVDHIGNVIIKKEATSGMEDRAKIVLQGHIDMVHQKNASTEFDFNTQGIQSYIDGEWVKAKGTTLGADNGMGVAAIMAILSSTDISHPAIEALFTIDEETGMTGAIELKPGMLTGEIMLNLDTEEDNELCIGCAGGIDTNVSMEYSEIEIPSNYSAFEIAVKGLIGGHSGMDIHKERGNANRIMNRILLGASQEMNLGVVEIDGGGLRNVIPRESFAKIVVDSKQGFEKYLEGIIQTIKQELRSVEKNLEIDFKSIDLSSKMMESSSQLSILRAISAMPNGVYRMSTDMEDLVETSSNLARVIIREGKFTCLSLQRSSVDTQKQEIAQSVRSVFELIGAKVENGGEYPGWTPKPDAPIVSVMQNLYEEMFVEKPFVSACHAGLECGILGQHYDSLQMISFGPTIRGAHSPDERVNIASVEKFWKYLIKTLENIPVSAN